MSHIFMSRFLELCLGLHHCELWRVVCYYSEKKSPFWRGLFCCGCIIEGLVPDKQVSKNKACLALKGSMARDSSQSSINVIVNSGSSPKRNNSCDEGAQTTQTSLDREASSESLLPEKEECQIELRKDGKGLGITVAGYICEKGDTIQHTYVIEIHQFWGKLTATLKCIITTDNFLSLNWLNWPISKGYSFYHVLKVFLSYFLAEDLSGIFVKSVIEGSAADLSGQIMVNDQIVAVSGGWQPSIVISTLM